MVSFVRSRLLQLLLPEEHKAQDINRQHEEKTKPEVGIRQLLCNMPRVESWEDITGPDLVGRRGSGEDRSYGSDYLRSEKGEGDVEAG